MWALWDGFREKVEKGEARIYSNRNMMGQGYKFDDNEKSKIKDAKAAMKKQYGLELNISDYEASDDEIVNKKEKKEISLDEE